MGVYLHSLQVHQQILWLEVCFPKTNMHIACLVSPVFHLASLEVFHCLHITLTCQHLGAGKLVSSSGPTDSTVPNVHSTCNAAGSTAAHHTMQASCMKAVAKN